MAPRGELKPIKKFTDRKSAVTRIWQAIQRLNAAVPEIAPEAVAEVPDEVAGEVALTVKAAHEETSFPEVAAVAETASTEQTATKQSERNKTPKPAQDSAAPRETKLSRVVAMLQRPEGATITEIMPKMGWLKHTVRGFMAGTMKKSGYAVESFNPRTASAPTASLRNSIRRFPFLARPAPPRRAFCVQGRSPDLLLFTKSRSTNSTGFIVGCSRFAAGLFSSHGVDCDLSPYHRSLWPAT